MTCLDLKKHPVLSFPILLPKVQTFTLHRHSYFAFHVLKPIHSRSSLTQPHRVPNGHWLHFLQSHFLIQWAVHLIAACHCRAHIICPFTDLSHSPSRSPPSPTLHLHPGSWRWLKNKRLVPVISLEVYLDQTLGPPYYTSLVNLLSGCLSWLLFPSCPDYQRLPFC